MTEEDEDKKSEIPPNLFLMPPMEEVTKTRVITLYGTVEEERANALIQNLYYLKKDGVAHIPLDPEDPESDVIVHHEPIQLLISSEGGDVSDMFSIYDVMRQIREECEIHTCALGKTMSAALPLVAAGTKGQRTAGKYCRFMFHGISGGNFGPIHDLKNDMKEFKWIQDQYVDILLEETSMTKRQVNRLLNKKIDIYFDAAQALEWGIVDKII